MDSQEDVAYKNVEQKTYGDLSKELAPNIDWIEVNHYFDKDEHARDKDGRWIENTSENPSPFLFL